MNREEESNDNGSLMIWASIVMMTGPVLILAGFLVGQSVLQIDQLMGDILFVGGALMLVIGLAVKVLRFVFEG